MFGFKSNIKEITVSIEGMSCNHCVASVKKALGEISGVKSASVSLENKSALVKFDQAKCDEKSIVDCITNLGFKACVKK